MGGCKPSRPGHAGRRRKSQDVLVSRFDGSLWPAPLPSLGTNPQDLWQDFLAGFLRIPQDSYPWKKMKLVILVFVTVASVR